MGLEKMQEIMERMKKRREELDMSYQTLAIKVGISKSTLQRYETGNIKNMPVDKLEAIATALDVSPAYLMGWETEEAYLKEEPTYEDVEQLIARNGKKMSTEDKLKLIKLLSEANL